MDWRRIIKDPRLEAPEKVKRIASILSLEYGEGKAMLYSGGVLNYETKGTGGGYFDGTELEELWSETKNLLDKERMAPKPRRGKKEASVVNDAVEQTGIAFDIDIEKLDDKNRLCGLDDRPEKIEGKLYVNDVIDMNEIVAGKLNILFAPTGSGKTTFIEGPLKKYAEHFSNKLLYLAPTCSIVDSMKQRGRPRKVRLRDGREEIRWEQEGIAVMTYASFASQIERARDEGTCCASDWWGEDALICLDELDEAVRYSKFSTDNLNKTALRELMERCRNPTNTVVMLSATPKAAIDHFFFRHKVPINVIKSTSKLEGYKTKDIVEYNELDNILMSLDPAKRGIIYADRITDVKEIVDTLNSRGICSVGIWSIRRSDYPMSEEQLGVRNALIQDEMIAEGVQVLVFNASYKAGVNIKADKSPIDYAIVHNSNPDYIAQARGRYRGDLDILYHKIDPKKLKEEVRGINEDILLPYLDMRLRTPEKNEIREALNLKNNRNRLMSWSDLVKHIKANGYLVTEHKSGGERYWLIRKF